MPVLMNKGDDPRQAAWLFYTDQATLDNLGTAAWDGRFDAGTLVVDAAELGAAKKASSEVPVYLEVKTLVPQDFDLGQIEEGLKRAEAAAREAAENPAAAQGAGDAEAQGVSADEAEGAPEAEDPADDGDALPYEPVAAPEGLRVRIGTTTAAAARSYIVPRETSGEDEWDAELPGLQMLVSLIRYMREHNALAPFVTWHVDVQGILRMAPAKSLKPMAGNILKAKL